MLSVRVSAYVCTQRIVILLAQTSILCY